MTKETVNEENHHIDRVMKKEQEKWLGGPISSVWESWRKIELFS